MTGGSAFRPEPTAYTRLPLLTAQEATGESARVLGKLEAAGRAYDITRAIANAPAALRPFTLMAQSLLVDPVLPPAVREVVVLHVANRLTLEYAWTEHVAWSEVAGVSQPQRDAIARGDFSAELFSPDLLLAIGTADSLLDGLVLTDESWRAIERQWGRIGAMELVFAVGWWGGFVATVLRGFALISPSTEERARPIGSTDVTTG